MSITVNDLRDFNAFAMKQMKIGSAESIADLALAWEERRESISDLLESHEDVECGRVIPADQVYAEIRQQLGLSE